MDGKAAKAVPREVTVTALEALLSLVWAIPHQCSALEAPLSLVWAIPHQCSALETPLSLV
ncbi:hypothetical protein DL346_27645 [Paenibacillus montanisoli]|uniref:Uncharacterized protein n=1 Tax=Paenibacillus montanisoli TaxID=2081970 RepID=A0A328TSB4_9BACL|nr:hypothetical protein DL346_27645 [Paenibacillus montanisoli]